MPKVFVFLYVSVSIRDGDGRTEGVEGVAEEGVIRRYETPFVFSNVVDFTWHVVVAADDVDFVLNEEGLVADSQLVHMVQRLPVFGI